MKIKLGPVEVEQDAIKDETLYEEYKKSPKEVEKYLAQRSKQLDLTLQSLITGKTVKAIRDFIFTIIGGIIFAAWSIYVFYVSKDAFVWKEMNFNTVVSVILQALLIIVICFLPAALVGGGLKTSEKIRNMQEKKKKQQSEDK